MHPCSRACCLLFGSSSSRSGCHLGATPPIWAMWSIGLKFPSSRLCLANGQSHRQDHNTETCLSRRQHETHPGAPQKSPSSSTTLHIPPSTAQTMQILGYGNNLDGFYTVFCWSLAEACSRSSCILLQMVCWPDAYSLSTCRATPRSKRASKPVRGHAFLPSKPVSFKPLLIACIIVGGQP